jgi:hypothetical protein
MPQGSGGEAMGRDDLIAGFLLAASLGLAIGLQLMPAARNGWQGGPAHAPASPW